MDMEKMAKFEALENSTFAQELENISTAEELQGLLAKHGIEMTMDEVNAFLEYANKQNSEELSAEDLDDVAGGAWWVPVAKWAVKEVAKWLIVKGVKVLVNKLKK